MAACSRPVGPARCGKPSRADEKVSQMSIDDVRPGHADLNTGSGQDNGTYRPVRSPNAYVTSQPSTLCAMGKTGRPDFQESPLLRSSQIMVCRNHCVFSQRALAT